jgi:hypothetical protein
VAGAGGVEDAVGERNREQGPDRAAVSLGGANGRRHLAIEFRLLGHQPADDTADLRVRSGGRTAERILRQRALQRAIDDNGDGDDRQAVQRRLSVGFHAHDHQGQSTLILLANIAP